MSGDRSDDYVPKAARTEIFYFAARVAMLAATLIGLPAATWLISRVIAKADQISENVDAIRLSSSRVEMQLQYHNEKIGDHEIRLRSIERKP